MEIEVIKARLKSIIKKQKLNYKSLGEKIGMSESGVKKIFSSNDISMSRLSSICKALDVSLGDVIATSSTMEIEENYRLSPEQERFFLNNWDYYAFYWVFCIEHRSLDYIKDKYALSDNQVTKYLLKLDEIGIVEYHSDDKVYWKTGKFLCFDDQGEFNNYSTDKFSLNHLKRCQKEISKENVFQGYHTLKLRRSSFNEFKVEIGQVVKKYVDQVHLENMLDEDNRNMLCFTFALSHDSYVTVDDFKNSSGN